MTYYHMHSDVERHPDYRGEYKDSDGSLLTPPYGEWTPELAGQCGFKEVMRTSRPDDTPTTTWDRSVQVVDGTPVEVWSERAKTPAETDADADADDYSTARTRGREAVQDMRTLMNDTGQSTIVRRIARNVLRIARALDYEMRRDGAE